ncbi:DUF4369 domain-containing protein [Salegentibacter mishustinae]|uniref:DUF4369 domain-containing protein n=1 Tax=Salegentibacter mishustinae TaxID=270918 RepID=UPI001CE0E654|nr:DUF4369 domain-containing protein [Salegentibacter mishustinae]UBZ07386.1 DUF4369 domain-containing protein [Salegentibacter mishustinae]
MKKISILLLAIIALISCNNKESNLTVNANIEGLKKGTVYLQKIEDTLMVDVDSVEVNGNANISLEAFIESPQVMYLYLKKVDNSQYDDRIDFFAEEGEVTINTTLEKFVTDAEIIGAKNQEKLEEYRKMMTRFNDKNLELIKENFEAQKEENEEKLIEVNKQYESLLKRKYLYTVNFAINNKDLEVAPYLALSEVFDANIKYLDTIYNSLEPKVKKSMYGKELKDFLKERKEEQKEIENIKTEETDTTEESVS